MSLHAYSSNVFKLLSYMQNVKKLNDCQNLLFHSAQKHCLCFLQSLHEKGSTVHVSLFIRTLRLYVILLHVHRISDTLNYRSSNYA